MATETQKTVGRSLCVSVDFRGSVAWIGVVCWLLLGGVAPSDAASVGSPSEVLKKGEWVLGLDATGLFDSTVKSPSGAKESLFHAGHFRGYGLTDWLSLYANIGWAYLTVSEAGVNHNFSNNAVLGAQLRNRFWRSRNQKWEWDGMAGYTWIGGVHVRRQNQARWQQWDAGTTIARSFGSLKPYAGVKVSLVNLDFKLRKDGEIVQTGQYKQDRFIGPVVGTDFALGEDAFLTVESSYIDGANVTVAISRRF